MHRSFPGKIKEAWGEYSRWKKQHEQRREEWNAPAQVEENSLGRAEEASKENSARCHHDSSSCLQPTPVLIGQHLCLYRLLNNVTFMPVWAGAGTANNQQRIDRIGFIFTEKSLFECRQDRPYACWDAGEGQEAALSPSGLFVWPLHCTQHRLGCLQNPHTAVTQTSPTLLGELEPRNLSSLRSLRDYPVHIPCLTDEIRTNNTFNHSAHIGVPPLCQALLSAIGQRKE